MKRTLFLITIPLLCFASALLAQQQTFNQGPISQNKGSTYPELTPAEKQAFNQAMDQELANAQKLAKKVMENYASGGAIDPTGTIRADVAAGSLRTKAILVQRFRDAPSIRSPKVREKLLSILKQDEVTILDLQELDQLVQQERPKL